MADATPVFPTIPTGEELYNALMSKIEPDLVTSVLPTLDAKYKGESKEDAAARAKRYEAAFAEYEKQLKAYVAGLQGQVHQYKRAAIQSAEKDERTKEGTELNSLEQAITNI